MTYSIRWSYAIQTLRINTTQFVPVISISYGGCEQAFAGSDVVQFLEAAILEQANAQGQTVVAASGDSGSADCDLGTNNSGQPLAASHGLAIDYPPSSQYVTAAGGTSFSGDIGDQSKYWNSGNTSDNGSAISYIPETTWNDTPTISELTATARSAPAVAAQVLCLPSPPGRLVRECPAMGNATCRIFPWLPIRTMTDTCYARRK